MIDEVLEVYQKIITDEEFTIIDEFGDKMLGKIICFKNVLPKIQNNEISLKMRSVVTCEELELTKEDNCYDYYDSTISYYFFCNGFVYPEILNNIFKTIIKKTKGVYQTKVNDYQLIVNTKTSKFQNIGNDENGNYVYKMPCKVRILEKQ